MITQAVIPLLSSSCCATAGTPVGRAQLAQQWKQNQSYKHISLAVLSVDIKKQKNPLLAQRAIYKGLRYV